jgi:hypothetical protein
VSEPQTIQAYLEALDDLLCVRLARRERILTEAHAHLREEAAAQRRSGTSQDEAKRRAIAAFGTPEDVAASHAEGDRALGRLVMLVSDLFYLKYGGVGCGF